MITIDGRIGSKELTPFLPKGTWKLGRLNFADACWIGTVKDEPVTVGMERKSVRDLLNSMSTGRLSGHQLVGLKNSYDVVYLVVEGVWRLGADGQMEVPSGRGKWRALELGRRKYMAREYHGYLNTLGVLGGLIVRETRSLRHTAKLVLDLYNWWSKKGHTSHLAIHKNRFAGDEEAVLVRPGLVRRVAAEITGIGWGKSLEVAKRFQSVKEMVEAGEKEWREIPGIGKTLAKTAVEELTRVPEMPPGQN